MLLSERNCREEAHHCMSMISERHSSLIQEQRERRWRRTDHPSRGEVPPPSAVGRFDRILTSHSLRRSVGLYFSLPCFAFSFGLSPIPTQRVSNFTDPSDISCTLKSALVLQSQTHDLTSPGKLTVLDWRLLSPPRYRRGKPYRRSCCPLSNSAAAALLASSSSSSSSHVPRARRGRVS